MKKTVSIIVVLAFLLSAFSGCTTNDGSTVQSDSTSENQTVQVTDASFDNSDADMFSDRDFEVGYGESSCVNIVFSGDSVTATSDSVKIIGSTVTLTEEADYVLSGKLNDGSVIVNSQDTSKLHLVFNGVNINSSDSAPLNIINADKVFVTLVEGTQNTLSNGGEFKTTDESNIDGVIFSKSDITFNGSGSLEITSPAGNGIVGKDDLVITSGNYTVNCASHGLDANDSVRIANANITVDSGKDGIHCENSEDGELGYVYFSSGTFKAEAEGDGISASNYVHIKNGLFDILAGGGSENGSKQSSDNYGGFMGGGHGGMDVGGPNGMGGMNRPMSFTDATSDTDTYTDESTSMKGIKSSGSMLIENGDFNINSADDAVHSNLSVTVNGGTFQVASGDDGFHADENLTIYSGVINITECYEGLEALNVNVAGGDIKLKATDDGLNAAGGTDSSGTGGRGGDMFGGPGGMMGGNGSSNGSVVISGGTLYINSSGDGIDANGTLEISGGYTTVVGPTQGDTATLDYDKSATISGGTFIGTGASGMAQTFSQSSQGVISLSVGNQSAGTIINLKDSDGATMMTYSPELSFAVLIISSPDIISGETYTVEIGSYSGEFQAQ
ncbi:MAG: carbohydrate-binding domain-containing protein [Clostridia bacterium]|nr:carbohydrate-binding domain-containing protein [Clostridia bacterium]